MYIDNIYTNKDANGRVVDSYVDYYDFNNKLHRKTIYTEKEYLYYMEMLTRQNKRTEELKKLTPRSEYNPKTYRYMLPEYNTKGLKLYKPLIALLSTSPES